MKKYIKSSEAVLATSFNRVLQHMNETECCFITAFRSDYSTKENRRRNKKLYAEIKASGLSFIKANGGFVENLGKTDEKEVTEDTFCVINNQYTAEDFIKLACKWCGEFDQESVLITEPVEYDERKHTGFSGQVHVVGRYYDRNGNVDMEFNNVSMRTVEEYFTNIANKAFVLSSISACNYTRNVNRNSVGRRIAHDRFTKKYNM